jgi:hypothetical protein
MQLSQEVRVMVEAIRGPKHGVVVVAMISCGRQCRAQSWQADDCGLSSDTAQKGINRENERAAGFMIAKTFFLA